MYNVKIKIDIDTYAFEAQDAYELYEKVNAVQNLDGFISACYSYGCGDIDEEPLKKMEAFVDKYYNKNLSIDDFRNLEIHTTTGDITVLSIEE